MSPLISLIVVVVLPPGSSSPRSFFLCGSCFKRFLVLRKWALKKLRWLKRSQDGWNRLEIGWENFKNYFYLTLHHLGFPKWWNVRHKSRKQKKRRSWQSWQGRRNVSHMTNCLTAAFQQHQQRCRFSLRRNVFWIRSGGKFRETRRRWARRR